MIILGITGTLGAGKGTIVDYLADRKGFNHFSVRAFLLKKIVELGMPENRDSMFHLANELRAEYGPAYVVDELFRQSLKSKKNAVIESIRTTGEILSLRRKGPFFLLAVDADPLLRYQRVVLRKSETDQISFQTFIDNEKRESISADPGVQNLKACIELADFTFSNNGTREELYHQVDRMLLQIGEDIS